MKQQYVYGLAAFLAIAGLSVFVYKWQVLGFPIDPRADEDSPVFEFSVGGLGI